MKRTISVLLVLCLAAALAAGCKNCGKKNNESVPPESIEITNAQTTVGVGEFEITAKVLPENADQRFTVSVVGAPAGISVSGNKISVAGTAENGLTFTVKAVSLLDMLVEDKMTFTVDNPPADATPIGTAAELSAIRNDLSGNYILTGDIDLEGAEWQPIGTPDMEDDRGNITTVGVGFAGRLNGNGYTIKNFKINDNTAELVGLFAQIESTGIVEKLALEGEMNAYRWFGALAGLNHGIIRNCFVNVNATGAGFPVSAIAGNNKGTVENTLAVGKVSAAEGTHGAAFVGSTDGNVISCYAHSGNIPYAFGWNKQPNAAIQKTEAELKTAATYSSWDPNVWYIADGIYPMLKHPGFTPPEAEILVSVTNTERWIDLKAGVKTLQIQASVVNATDKSVTFSLKQPVEGVTLSEGGLLGFADNVKDNSYVTVIVTSVEDSSKKAEYTLKVNNFDKQTYIGIKSLDDLANYLVNTDDPTDLTKNYRLENNIDFSADTHYNTNIGLNANCPFTGVFDGAGYALIGFQGGNSARNFGLFKEIGEGGIVKNLAISMGAKRMYVGGDSAAVASVNRGLIENIYLEGEIMCTGTYVAGVAFDNYGTIRNVVMRAKLLVNESLTAKATVAAIAYNNQGGKIENCFVDKNETGLTSITALADAALDLYCYDEADMKKASNFSMLDSEIWKITDGEIPTFKNLEK